MHTKKTLVIKNADLLVTMDDRRREIRGGCMLVEGCRIVAVGGSELLAAGADEELDLRGHVVIPGMVNTHHHMFQTLTRALPGAQDAELFSWLETLYPVWGRLTPEMIYISAQTAMAELMLSGCTTSSDHLYLFPNGCRLDDSIDAAREIGMRFHACRGSMSLGRNRGGLPPDALVEREEAILEDSLRLIQAYHDAARFSMLRIALAPCSPFSVSRELMKKSAQLARQHGVSLHTHLAENDNDVSYSQRHFGMTPAEYAHDLGWTGPDVWHAHCVKLDAQGIDLFARTQTGVAHCPCSNMRLASGIAPIRQMVDAGVPVGIGVDGSASNDGSSLLAEARQAMLLQRVASGPQAMSAREALWLATRGGAQILNRDDIGALAPDMAADFVAFDLRGLGTAGARHDPLAALVFCNPGNVALSVINGRVVIRDGQLQTIDLPQVIAKHNRLSTLLLHAEPL
ncbi:8-oxoguanine deaminase [Edwardsiella piscicida]|nr:8-oxoguanine deaminase [Edwardsiella piscicida]